MRTRPVLPTDSKRAQPIKDWLSRNDAICLSTVKGPSNRGDGRSILCHYSVKGRVIIVHYYGNDAGWEVYVPVSKYIEVDATLKDLDDFLAPPPGDMCTICHEVPVDVAAGFDTCPSCAKRR